jgi:hypothetical protein
MKTDPSRQTANVICITACLALSDVSKVVSTQAYR